MKKEPLILVTNDDGIDALGLKHIAALLSRLGRVVVVAPDGGRSGAACAVTSATTVGLREVGPDRFACTGTPVDCVKLALHAVCERRPDLIVSGINHGDNASVSVHYSGTMGAVIEGAIKMIPSIGFSIATNDKQAPLSPIDDIALELCQQGIDGKWPKGVAFNVNYPPVDVLKGLLYTRQSLGDWATEWTTAHNPRGEQHYWLTGHFVNQEPTCTDTAHWALAHRYAAATPVNVDMTHHEILRRLRRG